METVVSLALLTTLSVSVVTVLNALGSVGQLDSAARGDTAAAIRLSDDLCHHIRLAVDCTIEDDGRRLKLRLANNGHVTYQVLSDATENRIHRRRTDASDAITAVDRYSFTAAMVPRFLRDADAVELTFAGPEPQLRIRQWLVSEDS